MYLWPVSTVALFSGFAVRVLSDVEPYIVVSFVSHSFCVVDFQFGLYYEPSRRVCSVNGVFDEEQPVS
jgi:hypothetical protein